MLFSRFRIWFALAAFAVATPAMAQYQGPIATDRGFGSNGLARLPTVDPAHPGSLPLGFVRMPLSGGYVHFSVQQVGSNARVVASRYTDNGTLNTGWGSGGSQIYALPVPDGIGSGDPGQVEARVVVGLEGSPASEILYLVGKLIGGDGKHYLTVARFAANGSLLAFSSDNLPVHFAFGAGSIVSAATSSRLFGAGGTNRYGVLVAVQGRLSELNKTALIQIQESTIFETFSSSFTRPDLRINQLVMNADGKADVVGTEGGKALYMQYDASNDLLLQERFFDLPCASGATASVADGLVRNAALGSDVLLVGRANCTGGGQASVLARVANIATAPGINWRLTTADDLGGCGSLLDTCPVHSVLMSTALAGRIYATLPTGYLAHVNGGTGSAALLGFDALLGSDLAILPAPRWGTDQSHPYLAGLAYGFDSSSGFIFGLGRIALDRTFAGGFDP